MGVGIKENGLIVKRGRRWPAAQRLHRQLLFGRFHRPRPQLADLRHRLRRINPCFTKYAASTVPVRPSPAAQWTATPMPDAFALRIVSRMWSSWRSVGDSMSGTGT